MGEAAGEWRLEGATSPVASGTRLTETSVLQLNWPGNAAGFALLKVHIWCRR